VFDTKSVSDDPGGAVAVIAVDGLFKKIGHFACNRRDSDLGLHSNVLRNLEARAREKKKSAT
jgi:hypothetical protein